MLPRPRIRPQPLRDLLKHHAPPRRTIIAAPRPGSGPLMERRPDRELPTISTGSYGWLRSFPIFVAIMTGSVLAIFNYQKQSSSVVSSTLYALRTNPEAREILGDEIYFNSKVPIIWGEINQLHGRIDISFWVKGSRTKGLMRFKSERKTRMGYFDTLEWSLEPSGGEKVSLLQDAPEELLQQETADKIVVPA
ncbi:cytochrome oxidase assembly protein 1 [Friedmanniomyces endolithicus]|uniref:Cytochrome oxidase assembly protein 1 n=1 Tax=Friedmanniomyces endolithicus TaxID=329885 RepID=A0AAN6G2W4_9PEZI|nr:cytochrome oxidase assembly protein 1 [Friedmanniomyces endolithicus]KAK0294343.1 cytochrome oxidase assembly protein 1 [Friedmanniomyces endolithicus]KAK0326800.1 cytochrome oxidase assembly protein 1 [Friedmanniomyces endolithicus]KAK1013357.1 cytochrome oxidase assembly protein 1 [Friedmanniomyces endolithicus]KAK1059534.1 cytochrome oxidase assembly protein 1 [Friedmanniomyces endolithicus]